MAFTIRTDPEMEEALDALSAEEGRSRQEVIRRLVMDRYHLDAEVRAAIEDESRRWREALDALRDA